MFFYAGIYSSAGDAEANCDAIKGLNDSGAIGSYDSAIIIKQPDGDVRVTKTEKPAEHGAWIGVAAGAGAAIVFTFLLPSMLVAGGAGAGLAAWFAHLAHGTSRGEAKRIGAMLNDGDAAVVVIGVDNDAERVESAATRARTTSSSASSATGRTPSRTRSRPSVHPDRMTRAREPAHKLPAASPSNMSTRRDLSSLVAWRGWAPPPETGTSAGRRRPADLPRRPPEVVGATTGFHTGSAERRHKRDFGPAMLRRLWLTTVGRRARG